MNAGPGLPVEAAWLQSPKGPVYRDVANLVWRRAMFRRLMRLGDQATPPVVHEAGGELVGWIRHMYAGAQAIGVRRLNSSDKRDASLRRLLKVLKESPPRRFAADEISADLEELWRIAGKVSRYADKVVAHTDLRVYKTDLTFGEMHDSIDRLCVMVNGYSGKLLNTTNAWSLMVIGDQPWETAFTVPWIDGDDALYDLFRRQREDEGL